MTSRYDEDTPLRTCLEGSIPWSVLAFFEAEVAARGDTNTHTHTNTDTTTSITPPPAKRARTDTPTSHQHEPTLGDVSRLMLNPEQVSLGASVSLMEAQSALTTLHTAVLSGCYEGNASDLPVNSLVSSGCEKVDAVLGGGFRGGQVYEVAGAAGNGKTQLLLQTALLCVAEGVEVAGMRRCLFLASEAFPAERAMQIADHIASRKGISGGGAALMEEILVSSRCAHQTPWSHLQQCLANIHRLLEMGVAVSCVVLDSVAAACGDFRGDACIRAPMVASLFRELKRAAQKHNFPILVSNHVVAVFQDEEAEKRGVRAGMLPYRTEKPALGISWASIPNTHILLSRAPGGGRKLEVTTSSHLPSASLAYEVREDGVFALG